MFRAWVAQPPSRPARAQPGLFDAQIVEFFRKRLNIEAPAGGPAGKSAGCRERSADVGCGIWVCFWGKPPFLETREQGIHGMGMEKTPFS